MEGSGPGLWDPVLVLGGQDLVCLVLATPYAAGAHSAGEERNGVKSERAEARVSGAGRCGSKQTGLQGAGLGELPCPGPGGGGLGMSQLW